MPGLMPQHCVVPVDFSEFAFAALDKAIEIVAPDGTIDVVHVLPAISANDPAMLYGSATDETRMKVVSDHLQQKLSQVSHPGIASHILLGDAGSEITTFAKERGADLIVIPSHGYGFIKRVLMGSVAERVVRLAHCPVLVLRS